MILEILEAFDAILVRPPVSTYRRFGVPVGGPFDHESHLLANALVGNEAQATTLEIAHVNAEFLARSAGVVSLVGADAEVWVDDAQIDGQSRVFLFSGQRLKIRPKSRGNRIYLASPSGWRSDSDPAKGSLLLSVDKPCRRERARLPQAPESTLPTPLRIVHGSQFEAKAWATLCESEWRVSRSANRTGIRVDGPAVNALPEIASEPACIGAVQITHGGQPIILGPEGPTIAGYPKVAVVCQADLDRLGQLRSGDRLRFTEIGMAEAQALNRAKQHRLDQLANLVRLASRA